MLILHASFQLAVLLFAKHFLADGYLQSDWQVRGKARLLHPGGLTHAAIHASLTYACFTVWSFSAAPPNFEIFGAHAALCISIAFAEFVVHYAIDYFKSQVDRLNKFADTRQNESGDRIIEIKNVGFFNMFLADQGLHSLTYLVIVYATLRTVAGG